MEKTTVVQTDRYKQLKEIENRLAPMWSLQNFVAVNPYFGLHNMSFEEADSYLSKINGSSLFRSDISDLNKNSSTKPLQTLSDFFSKLSGRAWNIRLVDYVSSWCAAYFDTRQSLVAYPKSDEIGLFNCFLEDIKIDKSLSIFGLKSAKSTLSNLPDQYQKAFEFILDEFQLQDNIVPMYLHRLIMQYKGWGSLIRKNVWQDELENKTNDELSQFHTCLLILEYLIFKELSSTEKDNWRQIISEPSFKPISSSSLVKHKLQNEYEESQRQILFKKINSHSRQELKSPDIQAIFCIDVRSEIFRRHLEAESPSIETIGFAGFFGAPFKFNSLTGENNTAQLPVLLTPSYIVEESLGSEEKNKKAAQSIRMFKDIKRAWIHFKLAAVSCFSFMSPVGILYLPILLKKIFFGETYKETKSAPLKWKGESVTISCSKKGVLGISIQEQITIVQKVLKGLSISNISPLVAIIGHESISQNNPYESALDCGACGGHSGQKNAMVMAHILNNKELRAHLNEKGVNIPKETYFIPAVHNTSTDTITFFETDVIPQTHSSLFNTLKKSCERAAIESRIERAKRLSLGKDIHQSILHRSKDWSQVRPEWGLANCHAFIAAPRALTRNLDLNGRVFLHSYDWRQDKEYGVLELILTAPVIVASWINLQYYASTVDNRIFGSGNKVLHNVVSGLAVLEGSYGDIRLGLPMQSLHDGKNWQHSLERLNVIIAAPQNEINNVLAKHSLVRNLFENRWIHLFSMSDEGKVTHQYDKNGKWDAINLEKEF